MSSQYTIDDLVRASGFPIRTIRFYIQQGLVPASAGRGLGAGYGESHLKALLEIRRLQESGIQLSSIRARLQPVNILAEPMGDQKAAVAKASTGGPVVGHPASEPCRRIKLAAGCELLVSEHFFSRHGEHLATLAAMIETWEQTTGETP